MGAADALIEGLRFIILNLFAGVSSIAVTTITNKLLAAVLLITFIIMSVLRSTSAIVEFAGETLLNSLAFVRDTVFTILTFMIQTIFVNVDLFVVNQFDMLWSLVVRVISVMLGETCFLA